MIIAALHGFFGTPDDWDSTFLSMDEKAGDGEDGFDVVTPDLSVWATRANVVDFESFAKSFNQQIRQLAEKSKDDQIVIAGYSLGARLAAHCVVDEPELYRSALLISMNPGIAASDHVARRDRLVSDTSWADRLRRDSWESVWSDWNNQLVLKPGSRVSVTKDDPLKNRRIEGRRQAWARALEIWSLGHQSDLRRDLLDWATGTLGGIGHAPDRSRLTLMTGTEDTKFSELTSKWLAGGGASGGIGHEAYIRHRTVLGAGHRILMEAPEDVASELRSLILTPP